MKVFFHINVFSHKYFYAYVFLHIVFLCINVFTHKCFAYKCIAYKCFYVSGLVLNMSAFTHMYFPVCSPGWQGSSPIPVFPGVLLLTAAAPRRSFSLWKYQI